MTKRQQRSEGELESQEDPQSMGGAGFDAKCATNFLGRFIGGCLLMVCGKAAHVTGVPALAIGLARRPWFTGFKSTPNCVLLATDIAARGLDIPAVDHVLHYQIPRSADTYIHRNGRTARANAEGFSMLMCAPDERKVARSLLNSVGRRKSLVED